MNRIFRCLNLALVVLLGPGVALAAPERAEPLDALRQNAVVRAVKNASPAVVNVATEYEVLDRSNPFFDYGLDPFFDSFFKDFFEPRRRRHYERKSLGSGVIVDGQRGFILTNEHVIARGEKISVVLTDEREFEAELVGAAPDFDLAVLRITTEAPLPALAMGDSNDLMIGETVIAIGNPFGFSNTVTKGVISALNRAIQAEKRVYRDFIQTDASINPGNSGGPLLNINGDLIGINTAIYAKARGIGFAIPINKARRVVDDLVKYGEIHVPWIGLSIQEIDPKLRRYLRTEEGKGVLVSAVADNSPAEEAGLAAGDVLAALGDEPLSSRETYFAVLREYAVGDLIPVEVRRDEERRHFKIHSRAFPEGLAEDLGHKWLGVRVQDITTAARLKFRIAAEHGVMVTELRPDAYLERIGLRPGDVIRRINEIVVESADDFKRAVVRYRHKASGILVIQRGDQQYHVTVKTEP